MKNLRTDTSNLGGATGVLRRRAGRRAGKTKQIITMSGEDLVLAPLLSSKFEQHSFRHGGYIHVSDLLYKCIRKIAFSELLQEDIRAETIWPGRGVTFELGHAVQNYVTRLLKMNAPRQLYGNWECPCETLQIPLSVWDDAKSHVCRVCGKPPTEYKEMVIRNDQYMITGSVDIGLLIEEYLYVNECKSMSAKQWNVIVRPKPEHLLQSLFYWWLFKEAGVSLWDRVSVIYVNKEFMWSGSPFKEFAFTPSIVVDRLDDFFHEASQLIAFRKDNSKLPSRINCAALNSPDAKECQFRQVCFEADK